MWGEKRNLPLFDEKMLENDELGSSPNAAPAAVLLSDVNLEGCRG